jgi:Ribosomal protein S2
MKLNKIIKLNAPDLTFFSKKNSVLLNLQILKTKIYKKSLYYEKSFFEMEEKFTQLKMALVIIYSYHFSNKTILFVGIPNKLVSTSIKMRHSHIFLPSNVWLKGIFTNKNSIRRYLKYQRLKNTKLTTNKINKLLTVTKIPKLIVIINHLTNPAAINEICKLRFPVISLDFTRLISEKVSTYSNFNTIFLNLLNSLFIKNIHPLKLFKNKTRINALLKYQYRFANKKPLEKILQNNLKKNKLNKLWKGFANSQKS